MADFTAKDVQDLRNATGAGMLDSKRALTEAKGNREEAVKWLRERGLGKAAERAGRESQEGAVAVSSDTNQDAIALVQLRSETDFGAKSPDFVNLANDLAALVASEGEDAVDQRKAAIEDLNISLKENVQLGEVIRFQAAPGNVLGSYLHVQNDRGVNGVIVELKDGERRAGPRHRRPHRLRPAEVPAPRGRAGGGGRRRSGPPWRRRAAGRESPRRPSTKITEGKLSGWFKRVPGGRAPGAALCQGRQAHRRRDAGQGARSCASPRL